MKKTTLLFLALHLSLFTLKAQINLPDNAPMVNPDRVLSVKARTSNAMLCYGDSTNLISTPAGGTAPYTYSWTPSAGLACPTCKNTKASPAISTTYTITVTDHVGNTATASVSITVDPAINLALSSNTLNPCKGSSVYLNSAVSGGTAPYTYSWTPAAPLNASNIYNPFYTANSNKTFTCNVTDAFGCTVSSTITETIDNISVSATDPKICAGTTTSLTANVTGANTFPPYTYSWMPSGQTNQTATGLSAANYTITVIDNNGCTATTSTRISYYPTPSFNILSNLTNYLMGDSLSANGGTPPYTYTVSPPLPIGGIMNLPIITTTYTMTVTDANGCSSSDTATFIPNDKMAGPCGAIFISEYIQDTVHHDDAIELYNPTGAAINLNGYYLCGTVNASLLNPPFLIKLHGTIGTHKTFLIANSNADTGLTNHARQLSDNLNFNGRDIVALGYLAPSHYNVQGTVIDVVGSPTIVPANNGWTVASGSTKNYTLVRKPNVVMGDPNWLICRNEWKVYPQGTFSYIGHFTNLCSSASDPDLVLSLKSYPATCGNPGYANFAIMAQSFPPSVLNNFIVDVKYTGAEFSGDNLSNLEAMVTQDTNFLYSPGNNDYGSISYNNLNDSVIEIIFGSIADSTIHGTTINATPQGVILVSLKIQNSCQSGLVTITDTAVTRAYFSSGDYAFIDSTYKTRTLDSTISGFTTCCPYQCNPYPCDPYLCHCYCCQYDSNGNCTDSCCPDTCYMTCTQTCYDTIFTYNYSYDTAWNYSSINLAYTNISYSGGSSITPPTCQPTIEPFTKPVNAGTNERSDPINSSIVEITGAGFGKERGVVAVPNANTGGSNFLTLDSTDILSWSENKIVVRMPNVIIGNSSVTPGSGAVQILNTCSSYGSNYQTLKINYNIIGRARISEKVRCNIAMVNNINSLVFRCDTNISNHPLIYAVVQQAIATWNCYTGVNWKLGNDTIGDTIPKLDGISSIYFSNALLPDSALMETFVHVDTICNNIGDSMVYVYDADIAVSRILRPGYTWNYNVSDTVFPGNHYYFYDALSHELGHAHLLDHVDDPTSLMYYASSSHIRKNILSGAYPGPQTLYGAFDVVNTSAANTPPCTHSILIPSFRECRDTTLSVSSISKNEHNLTLYPNPASNGNVTVGYQLTTTSIVQFKVTDCIGRQLIMINKGPEPPGQYTEPINIGGWAQGMYLFVTEINGEVRTLKFIKL